MHECGLGVFTAHVHLLRSVLSMCVHWMCVSVEYTRALTTCVRVFVCVLRVCVLNVSVLSVC